MHPRRNPKMRLALPLALSAALLLTACTSNSPHQGHDMSDPGPNMNHQGHNTGDGPGPHQAPPMTASQGAPFEVLTGTRFTLTAKESTLQLDDQTKRTVWTFNGTVPGPQLRVKQGETVEVVLKNELPEPVTIHWHGLPVPNPMDGIPGVTQNAVKPGESFTYRFQADVPGTYWYHSHQHGVVQVDKGLYGSLVVEPKDAHPVDRDYTVVLDEWMQDENMTHDGHADMNMNHGGHGDHAGMSTNDNGGHSGHVMSGSSGMPMSDAEMMPLMYTIFSANGKTSAAIPPLKVKEGEKVRIRLINAGFLSHRLHLQGHAFQIISTDGQPINRPPVVKDQLLNIAPGERYDIEFVADNPGTWLLEEHSTNPGARTLAVPIVYEGVTDGSVVKDTRDLPVLDLTKYGEAAESTFSLDDTFDMEYTMELGTKMRHGGGFAFTINGKTFPDTAPLNVKQGDKVKVKLVNKSPEDVHPMHLHGHFFQVLSKDGKPVTGSPLVKDTLNILPGEEYVVAFEADNPGNWMFHCHDLGHASQGMVTEVKYAGYQPDFIVDPTVNNKPE